MKNKQKNRKNRKMFLLKKQASRCAYCGCYLTMRTATLDHVVPRALGGLGTRENQVAACLRCNRKKADKSAHILIAELMQGLAA